MTPAADGDDPLAASLLIGGITPFSTVDWPGRLAAVCFLAGCPWRCRYCQNRILWEASAATKTYQDLLDLMRTRRGLLDGVVFSGGEPLAQTGLLAAVRQMCKMGFEVGLHTGGAWPERLGELLPYLSWVGFDVKAPWDDYERVTLVPGSGEDARRSLDLLMASGVDMEARTTWHPGLLSPDDLVEIGQDLSARGVGTWAVQAFRETGTDGSLPDVRVFASDVPAEAAACVPNFLFR
jgi:pyruvate formate lyase activating enzyme